MSTAAQLARVHWNETPLYLSEEDRYSEYPWLYEVAEFARHAGDRVLEIGCGTGCDLLQFAKHGSEVTGVDITDAHIELARQRLGNRGTIVKADMRELPFPDASFDYVYSHGVLHHSDQPGKAAKEILRVLRPGGRFNVQVYSKYSYFTLWRMLRYGRKWRFHIENSEAEVHIDLYTAEELRDLFAPNTVVVEKHQCKPFEFLAPLWGWYLVAKGRNDAQ
jgi:ubiquinone/menaquinone biosynthesis C-methylase UbiE